MQSIYSNFSFFTHLLVPWNRYERMFDNLVREMLSNELGMKAILKNAELLVFTSTELPLNYWSEFSVYM